MHAASILDASAVRGTTEAAISTDARTPLRITHVSTADLAGGAERVAVTIHLACLEAGLDSTLAVGFKFTDLPATVLIPNDARRGPWARALNALAPKVPAPPAALSPTQRTVRRTLKALAEPLRARRIASGLEDVDFPGTAEIPRLSAEPPQVMQLHNLHGGYFDLRELPSLCSLQPTVLTVHDTWLTSGHCAYSVDCDAWLSGCGACPHPDFPPTVQKDRTHDNWELKASVFRDPRTKLHLVSPSRWALECLGESMVAPAIATSRVIPNGVDQSVFRPGDRPAARRTLGIDPDALVFAFVTASGSSPYKDPETIESALGILAAELEAASLDGVAVPPVVFLRLGSSAPAAQVPGVKVINVPFLREPSDVARCLVAADVYLHAALAEVLPLGILEAQSCGLPAIVTRTGGAPECIEDGVTGLVVGQQDPVAMARAASQLATESRLRTSMSTAAAARAKELFSVERMTRQYLDLYEALAGLEG